MISPHRGTTDAVPGYEHGPIRLERYAPVAFCQRVVPRRNFSDGGNVTSGGSTNWFLAVALHWTGGLAAASFYLPFRGVKRWNWETYWLVGGFFSWIVAPLVFASLLVPDFWQAIHSAGVSTLFWTYFFGALWGVGGLTFGLTMRYLGVGLGMAIALGYDTAVGTLSPPIFYGRFGALATHAYGEVILLGVLVCLAGIAVTGMAGKAKECELPEAEKKKAVSEFHFTKGLLIATFSGVMSACFNFALYAAAPIQKNAKMILEAHHASNMWNGLPSLVVLLWGGFTANFIWCVILHLKNGSGRQYLAFTTNQNENHIVATNPEHPGSSGSAGAGPIALRTARVPLLNNYTFAALAGVTWYLQFFFYTMGQTKMPLAGKFSGWTLHMASIIIFATLWGVILHEWKGTSRRTHRLITAGIIILVLSTLIVGAGNYLKTRRVPAGQPAATSLLRNLRHKAGT